MTVTIDDLRKQGWTVGIAHGSVEVEEQALERARALASPQKVDSHVQSVAVQVATAAAAAGVQGQELVDLIARAAAQALTEVTAARDERVVFHERALEIARAMPDVWSVSGLVSRDDDHNGAPDAISVYVSTGPDGAGIDEHQQATLERLHGLPLFPVV